MDCRTFCRKLEDHLEGGLDFPGRFGMERHAEQCFACGKVYADALRLRRMTHELLKVKAPDNFEAAVLARIQAEGGRGRHGRLRWLMYRDYGWPRPQALAAGIAAALLLGVGLYLFVFSGLNQPAASLNPREALEGTELAGMMEEPYQVSGGTAREFTPNWVLEGELDPYGPMVSGTGESLGSDGRWLTEFNAAGAQDYVEFVVPGPGDGQWIMRLPRTIRMRHAQPTEEYFIRNVSH